MFGLMAMAAALAGTHSPGHGCFHEEEPDPARRAMQEEEQNRNRGLTRFSYGENVVWALNQKVADRKAKKKGWI